MGQSFLKVVETQTRERPLLALAVAGGAGLVLGRGFSRIGAWMALLGVGGFAGYTMIRNRVSLAE